MKKSTGLIVAAALAGAAAWSAQPAREAAPASPEYQLPRALEDWQGWVLKGQESRRCPFLADGTAANAHQCVWPERLQVKVDAHGGSFAQRWQVFSESWVELPGDLERWPQAVRLDDAPAPLVARDDRPYVRLPAGTHALSGSWTWELRPERLAIPADTALIDLTVDGVPVGQPESVDGKLTLGRQRTATEPRQLEVRVFRLIEDDEPLRLESRLILRVAGDAREETLGHVLPEGFIPLSLAGDLPARLESDGRLRVQVRPGRFELTLEARQAQRSTPLRARSDDTPARDEVWSFAANDRLRVAAAEGVPGIDPAQADVPREWRGYPAFHLTPGAELRLIERSRGLSSSDQNRLQLRRSLWLDFDHEGWTALDELSGTLRRDWRLTMRAPYQLQSARAGATPLLVTSGPAPQESGVEIRSPQLALQTLSRSAQPFGSLPATGWTTSFDSVTGVMHLPPGHRLLAVVGADESPTAWLDRWGLWNLFGLLVVIVFAYWVAGPTTAVSGALGLLLTYQAAPGFIWGWGNLLLAIALARAAPAGRLALVARGYRTVSFVALALALIPFGWTEIRHSIYPQLDVAQYMPSLAANLEPAVHEARLNAPPPPPTASPVMVAPEAINAPAEPAQEYKGARELEETVVTAARRAPPPAPAPLTTYAPGTLVQSGPGIPNWDYGAHPFRWSGPVEADQTVRFVVLGPIAVALWRIAGVVLLAGFLISLARASFGTSLRWPHLGNRGALAALAMLAVAFTVSPPVRAQELPDRELLRELRQRLTEAPRCAPTCAEILDAQVHVSGERIQIELQASALASLAVAVPSAADRWRIDTVAVDGASSLAVTRDSAERLWVPIQRGVHTIRIEGRLAGESIHLAFPATPRRIAVDSAGWDVSGINAGRLVSGALDLTRQRRAGAATLNDATAAQEFPAFVRVVRSLRLDLDWSAATTVERVAPAEAAFTVAVPLIPGESVLTEGLQVRPDGTALVGLAAGESQRSWTSSLKSGNALTLKLPPDPPRAEIWRFYVSPQWRVSFSGLPATLPDDPNAAPWVFEYRPRQGETLELAVTRPVAVEGRTLAIDGVRQSVIIGRRVADHELELRYRSTQGGRQTISLPKEASVTQVTVDATPVAVRPEGGELSLSLTPGEHTIGLAWRSHQAEALVARPDRIDLHTAASNVTTRLALPADRWPLLAVGRGVGPAFLYWGELAVFIVVATLLGRLRESPLRTFEWLLLGLGLSTLSWLVLVTVAVWLFAMRWRERSARPAQLPRGQFNALQLVLAALTLIATSSLVFSGVRYGLLATPDMGVVGPGSSGNAFSWFVDRSDSALPQPTVYSLPLWVYRTIMFAWALWIALALARWLRAAWRAWSAGGFWRDTAASKPAPAAG